MCRGEFTPSDFERAKTQIMEGKLIRNRNRKITLSTQPSFRVGRAFGEYILRRPDSSIAEEYEALLKLSLEDVKMAIADFIDPNNNQIFSYANVYTKERVQK